MGWKTKNRGKLRLRPAMIETDRPYLLAQSAQRFYVEQVAGPGQRQDTLLGILDRWIDRMETVFAVPLLPGSGEVVHRHELPPLLLYRDTDQIRAVLEAQAMGTEYQSAEEVFMRTADIEQPMRIPI